MNDIITLVLIITAFLIGWMAGQYFMMNKIYYGFKSYIENCDDSIEKAILKKHIR